MLELPRPGGAAVYVGPLRYFDVVVELEVLDPVRRGEPVDDAVHARDHGRVSEVELVPVLLEDALAIALE